MGGPARRFSLGAPRPTARRMARDAGRSDRMDKNKQASWVKARPLLGSSFSASHPKPNDIRRHRPDRRVSSRPESPPPPAQRDPPPQSRAFRPPVPANGRFGRVHDPRDRPNITSETAKYPIDNNPCYIYHLQAVPAVVTRGAAVAVVRVEGIRKRQNHLLAVSGIRREELLEREHEVQQKQARR